MIHKILDFLKSSKRKVALVLVILMIAIVVVLVRSRDFRPVTPPVVSTNELEIVSVDPQGDVQTLNMLVPIAIKFNENLDDVSNIYVTTSPKVSLKKYTVTSQPNVLWIRPSADKYGENYNWTEKTKYVITVEKGSKLPNGAILSNDFSFDVSFSTEGISTGD